MKFFFILIISFFIHREQALAANQTFSMPDSEALSGDSESIEWLQNQVSSIFSENQLSFVGLSWEADMMVLISQNGTTGGIYLDLKEFDFTVSVRTGIMRKYYRWEPGMSVAVESHANRDLMKFVCKKKLAFFRGKKQFFQEVLKCLESNLSSAKIRAVSEKANALVISEF